MLILALESATIGVGAAVVSDGGVLGTRSELAGRLSTERLHPLIDEVMHATGVNMGALDAIAVDIGPGLFTGLRVGVTCAKTLAFALGIPVLGLTSTRALLAGSAGGDRRSVAVVDMRRSEVVFAVDDAPDDLSLVTPEECARLIGSRRDLAGAHLVGDGASRYAEVFAEVAYSQEFVVSRGEHQYVDPAVLGVLAIPELRAGNGVSGFELEPLYLREADAKINWATRGPVLRNRP